MGTRGPLPNLDTERARRRGAPEPKAATVKAPPGAPTAPSWLSAEAKAEWKRVVPALDELGLLATVDRAALATYCANWSTFAQADREIGTDLVVVGYRGVTVKNPLLQIRRDAAAQCLASGRELLLTPLSRLRAVVAPADEPGDPDGILD